MVAVNESTIKGKPHPSISSKRILLLHVHVVDEDGFDEVDSIYASPDDFKDMRESNKSKGLHLLEFSLTNVSCEAWIKKGDPKDVICQEVSRVRPDLLVLGSRGLGRFQKVFVGTVSGFCVKHAECPSSRSNAMPMKLPVILLMTKPTTL
ncbi:hypothetical protein Bca52824_067882 [Brassica carinata]|uniref:UspA domain-containing protein n=1 Tax=Brassica carinata TaxID=52824 RepID=A0A8X7QPH6_BRACI|nr:hypothetical protein Bca52824_067882 [Brassica carinata]